MTLSDELAAWSLGVAIVSLVATLIAIGFAIWAIRRADATAGASTGIALSLAISEALHRLFKANEEDKDYELAELFNVCEWASIVINSNTLKHKLGESIEKTIKDTVTAVIDNDNYRKAVQELIQDNDTFESLKRLIGADRKEWSVVPDSWLRS